jgi:bacteriorhodopsin
MVSLNRSVSDGTQHIVALAMAWIILILWSFYPFIWVFGSQGMMAIGLQAETVAYMILDVLTKVGFASLLLWYLYLQILENTSEVKK